MAKFILDLNYPIEEQLDELNEVLSENGSLVRVKSFPMYDDEEDDFRTFNEAPYGED